MILHAPGVDNCSFRFRRKGRQCNLGVSGFPTHIFLRNHGPAYHQLWVYMCTFGLGLMELMVMAMVMAMAMVLVIVIVIILSEELRQVGWLRQCQHQTVYRHRAFDLRKLPQTQSFPTAKRFPWRTPLRLNILLPAPSKDMMSSRCLNVGSRRREAGGRRADAVRSRLPNGPGRLASFRAPNDGPVRGMHFGGLVRPSTESEHLGPHIDDCSFRIPF